MLEGKSQKTPTWSPTTPVAMAESNCSLATQGTATEQEWLSVEQFRRRHNLGKNLVYDGVRLGRLKSVKLGGKILIAANALALLAESQTATEPDQGQEDE